MTGCRSTAGDSFFVCFSKIHTYVLLFFVIYKVWISDRKVICVFFSFHIFKYVSCFFTQISPKPFFKGFAYFFSQISPKPLFDRIRQQSVDYWEILENLEMSGDFTLVRENLEKSGDFVEITPQNLFPRK